MLACQNRIIMLINKHAMLSKTSVKQKEKLMKMSLMKAWMIDMLNQKARVKNFDEEQKRSTHEEWKNKKGDYLSYCFRMIFFACWGNN